MKCVSALSTARSTAAAFHQILEKLDAGLAGETADLCLVFSSMHHADELAVWPRASGSTGKAAMSWVAPGNRSWVKIAKSRARRPWPSGRSRSPASTIRPLRLDEPGVFVARLGERTWISPSRPCCSCWAIRSRSASMTS